MMVESGTIQILLIEDDEDDYLLLKDYLEELDPHTKIKLDWVRTYQEGLVQILQAKHDLYLVDHYLGEYSGLDLLKEAVRAGCQAPIIIVTGLPDREIDQAAVLAGATDYLVKGQFDGKMLERSIRYALERNRLLNRIRELAIRDALTGLYNRRELHRFLDYELIKSKRYKHPFSILMMDIDHFKQINDRHGHRVGDETIIRVAQTLLLNTRGCDLPCRFGGDEFIIVLPETSAHQGRQAAERLRKFIESISLQVDSGEGGEETIRPTVSIGVAEFPADADSGDALIDAVDHALYLAKRLGCNQVVLFNKGG